MGNYRTETYKSEPFHSQEQLISLANRVKFAGITCPKKAHEFLSRGLGQSCVADKVIGILNLQSK